MPVEFERLCVVLVEPRNPLNIGAAARAMSNFGFLNLRVVNPYEVAFREARSAMGAAQLLKNATEFKTLAAAIADCALVVGTTALQHRELQHKIYRLNDAGRLMRQSLTLASSRVALLFGSEKTGLSNQDLSGCHWLLRIPARAEHASMNLGQAVAVCLYELARARGTLRRQPKGKPADAGDLERLAAMLLEALRKSGYFSPTIGESAANKIRRLIYRMELSAEDANLWLGILRQILWKIELV